MKYLAFALAASLSALATADEATVTQVTELKATPAKDGKSVVKIFARTQVDTTGKRQPGWVEVKLKDGKTGWLSDKLVVVNPPPLAKTDARPEAKVVEAKAAPAPTPVAAPTARPRKGRVVTQVRLQAGPARDTKVVATLPANTELTVIKQEDPWVQVIAMNQQGWLKLPEVHFSTGQGGDSGVGKVFQVMQTGKSGSEAGTAGKALDPEGFKSAVHDYKELAKLDQVDASESEARAFARGARLQQRRIDYLEAR